MYRILFLLLVGLVLSPSLLFSQSHRADSLRRVATDASLPDTLRLLAQLEWASALGMAQKDSMKALIDDGLQRSEAMGFDRGLGRAWYHLGVYYYQLGDLPVAEQHLLQSELIAKHIQDDRSLERIRNVLGVSYSNQGRYTKALEYYFQLVETMEAREDFRSLQTIYNNIGNNYRHRRDYEEALAYYQRSLDLATAEDRAYGIVFYSNNIGETYTLLGRYEEALALHRLVLPLADSANLTKLLGWSHIGEGVALAHLGQAREAQEALRTGLGYAQGVQSIYLMTSAHIYLGVAHRQLGEFTMALDHGEQATALSQNSYIDLYRKALQELHRSYAAADQTGQAYETLQRYQYVNDSVTQDRIAKEIAGLETDRAFEQERKEFFEASLYQERKIRRLLVGGGSTAFLAVGLVLVVGWQRRTNQARRQENQVLTEMNRNIQAKNAEIQVQNELTARQYLEIQRKNQLLAIKEQEVQESLRYAERIQRTVLLPEADLQQLLPEHFILNRPRDVVSGDFVWVENFQGRVYFAVADCTGHGVPGALMSVICSFSLSEALFEGNGSTGALLERTRALVIDRLAQKGHVLNDGMDLSLCAFDFEHNTVQWSGANRPLVLINRHRDEPPVGGRAIEGAVGAYEWKPDRQPIGMGPQLTSFTTHKIRLIPGDMLYLYTDGFQDQFGGTAGKKYRSRRLKQTLWELHTRTPSEQRDLLCQTFDTWRGANDQVDDVLLVGIRVHGQCAGNQESRVNTQDLSAKMQESRTKRDLRGFSTNLTKVKQKELVDRV